MIALLDMAACGSLCVTLLHSLWQMTLLAIVARAFGLAVGKERLAAAYWVHVAALLAGVLAIPSTYAIVHRTNTAPVATVSSQASASLTHAQAPSYPLPQAKPTAVSVPTESPRANTSQVPASSSSESPFQATAVWRAASPWLAIVYLIGVALMLLRLIGATVRLERLRAGATLLTEGPVAEALTDLCRRWKTAATPTLAHAANIVTPAVVGFLKPTILLPTSTLTGLSIDDLEMILAHELAHLRRHDAWVNLAQRLAEAVLFFNPAMWWLSRRVSTLREYCCDEAACAAIADSEEQPQLRYATAILRVVELSRGAANGKDLVAMAAAGRSPSELRRRVARLFGEPLSEPIRLSRGGVMAIVLGVAVVLGLPPLAESETQPPATKSESQAPKGNNLASPSETVWGSATISGTIVLEDGQPADVMGWLYSDSHSPGHSYSSLQGDFTDRFECKVNAGKVSLLHFPVERYAPAAIGPFQLKRGDQLDDVVITLTPGDSATLLVTDEIGVPIAEALVVKIPELNDVTNGHVHQEKTDQDGKLELSRLTPGARYLFRVESPGYQKLRTKPLPIPLDGKPLHLTMFRARPATGVVRMPDGSPCAGAKLSILNESSAGMGMRGPRAFDWPATDQAGRFSLDSLNDGSHYMTLIEAPDSNRAVVTSITAGARDLDIKLQERHDLVVIVRGDIDEIVKRDSKRFVQIDQKVSVKWPKFTSTFTDAVTNHAPIERTERGGEATFQGLVMDLRPDAGEQEVEVTVNTMQRRFTQTATIKRDGERVTRVEIELPPVPNKDAEKRPPLTLQGRVTTDDGKPLPGVKVQLYGGLATRWRAQHAVTDEHGVYRFSPLKSGLESTPDPPAPHRYLVGVEFEHPEYVPADGNSSRDLNFELKPGHVEVLDMPMTRGGTIAGVVLDRDTGEPIANLSLRINNSHLPGRRGKASYLVYANTDSLGRFESTPLYPGEYVVEINDGDYRGVPGYPQIGKAKVAAGESVELRLRDEQLAELVDPFVITGTAFSDDGEKMTYGGVGVVLAGSLKVRSRGGGIDGRPIYTLGFGPVDRMLPTPTAPYGVGTHEVYLTGSNSRQGYTLNSHDVPKKLRITDNPDRSQDEEGYVYIRPNEPLMLDLVFKKNPEPDGKKEAETPAAGGDLGSMQIRVLDREGQPLPAAKVYANRVRPEGVEGDRIIKTDLVTSNEGVVTLPIDRRADTTKLWAWADGKVSEFVYLRRGPQEQDALLPAEFEFRLKDGTSLGGVVVDDDGKSIPGVHVRVKVGTPALGLPPGATSAGMGAKPIVNSWLTDSFYQPTVKTDAEGRWRINNAPGPLGDRDHEFSIKLEHPDYQSDGKWGDLQRRQGVTTQQLRAGDAKIVMTQGVRITGAVVDTEGRPITNGWAVWSDEPYFFDSDAVTRINDSGHFTTPQLKPGEYPVIVIAPGYAAQKRMVKVEPGLDELRFELEPGKRIEIRIVDANGAPVPNASVYLGGSSDSNTWDRSNALHNQGGATEYGIPRRANERGVYVWEWAPEGAVRYSVGAKGYAGQEVRLVPKSEPHVVTLAEQRVVVGTVTDALSGEPVDSFLAMPVIVFGPEHWSTRLPDAKAGLKGEYTLPLRGAADEEVPYRVRIEAPGYRTIVSEESFGPKDGRKTLNVQLQPAPARIGRVIDANGQPVANAALLVGTPTWVPMTFNGEADEKPELRILTDAEGRFELAATTEPSRVRVVHDVGFAEALIPADAKNIGELQLKPWAKLTGTLTQDGQPVGDQQVYFAPFAKPRLGEARFQDSYYARTTPRGEFTFDRLPPIAGSVRAALGPWEESPLTSSESLVVNLKPGETREVTLGGEGAVLTGRVNPTGRGETPLDSHWSLNYLVSRDRSRSLPEGFPALGFDPSGPLQVAWMLDPHFNEWLATRANHFVKLTPDGRLRVTGIEPGEYDLVLRLYEQPAGCLVEAVGEKVVPISVTDGGVIDLGQIDVPCRVGPRVGSDMRAYGLVDATGRKVTVNDLAGRHVVLHVWASWCQPCLTTMPEIAATAEDLTDRPVTFVGLNVDADGPAAEALAAGHGWKWAQNYLGEKSDLAKQLALSTVPSYYLIGPDGKLVASSSDWKAIRRELELAFPTVQLGMR